MLIIIVEFCGIERPSLWLRTNNLSTSVDDSSSNPSLKNLRDNVMMLTIHKHLGNKSNNLSTHCICQTFRNSRHTISTSSSQFMYQFQQVHISCGSECELTSISLIRFQKHEYNPKI